VAEIERPCEHCRTTELFQLCRELDAQHFAQIDALDAEWKRREELAEITGQLYAIVARGAYNPSTQRHEPPEIDLLLRDALKAMRP
jgi:ribosome maturation protein Sdo1